MTQRDHQCACAAGREPGYSERLVTGSGIECSAYVIRHVDAQVCVRLAEMAVDTFRITHIDPECIRHDENRSPPIMRCRECLYRFIGEAGTRPVGGVTWIAGEELDH